MKSKSQAVALEMRGLLRAKSLRVTRVRLGVLEVLHDAQKPMTHEEVMSILKAEYYDKASVWRVLADLETKGILQRMDMGDRIWRYELFDDCRKIERTHAHFMCTVCHDVSCLPSVALTATKGELPAKLKNQTCSIIVSGICDACA